MLTILWTLRQLRRIDAKRLLAGETAEHYSLHKKSRHWIDWTRVLAIGLAIVLIGVGTQFSGEAQAGAFFGSGMLLLFASLSGLSKYFKNAAHQGQTSIFALSDLARSNAKRSPTRSTLAIGLVAAAVYLIVSISAFRLTPPPSGNDRTQGDGGFALIGQSDLPIYRDLGDAKTKAGFADQISTNDSKEDDKNREAMRASNVIPFRTSGGDDASCLNLYRPRRPRVVAVNERMIDRGGFTWAASNAQIDAERANPWTVFRRPADSRNAVSDIQSDEPIEIIPVILDQNTAMYSLQLYKGIGEVFTIEDDDGNTVWLEVAGLLKNSIFQGDILMYEANFKKAFPRVSGFNLFLIEPSPDENFHERIGDVNTHTEHGWEEALADNGLQVDSTRDRLVSLMAVQNTYLSTFQSLGGLGLILGTLGLAVVQLRSAIERRGELALLQAIGFSRGRIGSLLLRENISLLITGLVIGAVLALIAIVPNLWRGDAGIPWTMLGAILGIVIFWGVISGLVASRLALNSPIVETLRRDS
jgi:ABC-type antimicrobial peptide transport system permease subunit